MKKGITLSPTGFAIDFVGIVKKDCAACASDLQRKVLRLITYISSSDLPQAFHNKLREIVSGRCFAAKELFQYLHFLVATGRATIADADDRLPAFPYAQDFSAAAFLPEARPLMMQAAVALPPRRLVPCTPPVTSPAA